MKFSLSTNWCNRTIENGAEIAAAAKSLGFDALELGFRTTEAQAREIVESGILPVGSVHAFCPVPLSAPSGHPELYTLASFDDETRAMARFQIVKNIRFAASVGATALVLHLGRIRRSGLGFLAERRSRRMQDVCRRELGALVPELENAKVKLGLENLPYVEGFPNENELSSLVGDWVRPWIDTGHDYVRRNTLGCGAQSVAFQPIGLHVNDSNGGDDHLAPGDGKIDFAAFGELASGAEHVVLEPNSSVPGGRLSESLAFLRGLWERGCSS